MKKQVVIPVVIVVAIVLVFIGVQVFQSQHVEKGTPVVRVGYKPNSGYQNFFIAQEKGYFEKYGLTVEGVTFESTNQMIQALVNGDIDATPASSIEVLALVEQNTANLQKIYLTLVFEKENAFHSLLVPNDSQIKSLSDLKGNKIGAMPGSTSQSWLEIILGNFFDPKKDVEIIQLSPRLQLQALSSGQVDALYTVDPIITMGEVNGVTRVLMKGPENEYIFTPMATGGGVVSQRLIDKHPEVVQKLIRAIYDAVEFMRVNEAESRQIIAQYTKLDTEVANKMDLLRYWKLEETNYDAVQRYLDFLLEEDILTKPIKARNLYLDASVLE